MIGLAASMTLIVSGYLATPEPAVLPPTSAEAVATATVPVVVQAPSMRPTSATSVVELAYCSGRSQGAIAVYGSGFPGSEAIVSLSGIGGSAEPVTKGAFSHSFESVPSGTYTVTVRGQGSVVQFHTVTVPCL